MWFKNLSLLRFTEPFALSTEEVQQRLEPRRFRPCGSLEPVSFGWCPPIGKDEDAPLVHATNGYLMVCLQKEEKILPSSVVNEVVAEKAAELEEQRGSPLKRKEKETLRDEVMLDLLPRAFSHSRRMYAYIDPRGGWLVVDSSSAKKTDELSSLLRQCLVSLPVTPLATRERPATIMTSWLNEGMAPTDIVLDSECELRDPGEEGGIVRCKKHDLSVPEIQNHLEAGKEAIKLVVTWSERLSFLLDDSLSIKRLRFLDLVQEEAAEVEAESAAERFDADFAIMSLELSNFLPRLLELFGGENVPSQS